MEQAPSTESPPVPNEIWRNIITNKNVKIISCDAGWVVYQPVEANVIPRAWTTPLDEFMGRYSQVAS